MMNRRDIQPFLAWRKHNTIIAEYLSDDDLVRLFPVLEDYAQYRIKSQRIAGKSTAERAFKRVILLERIIASYKERGDIDQHVAQLTKRRTWR